MEPDDLVFVIPTYRLRDVGETVEQYDQHFWRNGHALLIMVFDDSSPANQDKYFPQLEQTTTHNDVFYVGPAEKEQFLAYLNTRLRDPRLEGLVRNLFQPSYGGNRNCALMYTLGALVVSSDDDMRPYALMEDSPESLEADEISRGRLHKAGHNHIVHKSKRRSFGERSLRWRRTPQGRCRSRKSSRRSATSCKTRFKRRCLWS